MGKSVDIPEAYKLEDLVDSQKELNRFDSFNDWGSQTWNDDKTAMTQSVAPELKQAISKNIGYATSDTPVYRSPHRMVSASQDVAQLLAKRAGLGSDTQKLLGDTNPNARKPGNSKPYPDVPDIKLGGGQQAPVEPTPVAVDPAPGAAPSTGGPQPAPNAQTPPATGPSAAAQAAAAAQAQAQAQAAATGGYG